MTTTINEYDIGDLVRVSAAFTDVNSAASDTTVALKVLDPAGTTTTPTVVHDSTGAYHYDISVNAMGTWYYRFEGTGVVQAASEGLFRVRDSAFY